MNTAYEPLLELFAARVSGRGWDGCCPFAHRHKNGDRNPSLRLWVGERGELVARCYGCGATWGEIVKAVGSSPREWWPGDPERHRRIRVMSKVVAIYDYRDESGTLYAQKLRKEPGPSGTGKTFSWRRPLPAMVRAEFRVSDSDKAWAWGLEDGTYAPHEGNPLDWRACPVGAAKSITFDRVVPSLYRLPELLASPFEDPVVVVEGEKKADALFALGLCAVSGPSGAKVWDAAWGEFFRERKVIVIPDNNPPGLLHGGVVAGSLMLSGAAGVKAITPGEAWPVADGEDIFDWLSRIPPKEQRKELGLLFRRFPAYLPQAQA